MRVSIYIKSSTWVECISESAQLPNDIYIYIYIFIYILKIQFKHAAYLHVYITCTSIKIVLSQFFQSEIYPSWPTLVLSWRTSSGYNRVFTNTYQSDQSKLGKMQWSRPLLENCTWVKEVVVQLATDQTLVATGSFQVLKVHLSS